LNAFRHGLAGAFMILSDEVREDFDELYEGLRSEHQPETPTEILLVESMAQHYWLLQRALRLQKFCFDDDGFCDEKQLALFLRYQTTHDRAFYKALNTLVKLRAEKRKAEIGFVSQLRQTEEHARKQAVEKRKQELHKWKVLRAEAEVDHRILLNLNLETPEHRISVGPDRIRAAEKAA
jgi:DNA-binding protein H-NS